MRKYLLSIALYFFCNIIYAQQIKIDKQIRYALDKVDTNRIKETIIYLADDKLKGRLPGEAGFQMATDYVLKHFNEMGLAPAGENGSYFQKIILRRITVNNAGAIVLLKDKAGNTDSLLSKKDVVIFGNALEPKVTINAPLVFAGYGIDMPGRYSDYEGLDVKGKIVVLLTGAPKGLNLPSSLQGYFVNTKQKMETAKAKGAIAVITSSATPDSLNNVGNSISAALNLEKTFAVGRFSLHENSPKLVARISHQVLKRMFINSGKNFTETLAGLELGTPSSFNLPLTLEASYTSSFKDISSWNLVAKIPGSDKLLKDEYVLHTAHLDHIGVGVAIKGDSIYNGAHDNASGVATLLEFARMYKQKGIKPRRSILLLVNTGEEMGLLGSDYFANYPTVPKDKLVAALNADMPLLVAPMLSIVPIGATHSSMYQAVEFACKQLNIEIQEDPMPEENRLTRSDHFSFIINGIPAMYIKYGIKTLDPNFDLLKYMRQWHTTHYHKPSDDINNDFDFAAAKTYTQLNFLISYAIAQGNKRTSWNKGDFFEKLHSGK